MRKLAALLAPLALAACAVGPDYSRPATPAPAPASGGFVTLAPGADPALPLPDDWWRLYDDPALDRLIARAFAANTDLRVAMANLERARAVLGEARAGRLPSTDLSGGATYGNSTQGGGRSSEKQWTVTGGLSASWEVDLFGRVRRAIEAARADAQAVEAVRDGVRVTVAAETARAYSNACAYADSAAIARQSLQTAEAGLRLITAQQKAGAASRLDVEQAATLAANARAAIPPLDGQRRVALFELAALIGETPAHVPPEAAACTRPPAPLAALPVGDGAALLRRRPDLREAERQLAADTARIGVATADLYPRITLGGAGSYFKNRDVPAGSALSFSVGPLLSWSFPNIAVARSRIAEAKAQGEASLAAFDGTVLRALKEVEQALSLYAAENDRHAALAQARDRAENAYRLADARYRAGSISYLDLLVSQRALTETRAALADSAQRLGSQRIDLFKALGGGWQGAANSL